MWSYNNAKRVYLNQWLTFRQQYRIMMLKRKWLQLQCDADTLCPNYTRIIYATWYIVWQGSHIIIPGYVTYHEEREKVICIIFNLLYMPCTRTSYNTQAGTHCVWRVTCWLWQYDSYGIVRILEYVKYFRSIIITSFGCGK